MLNDLNLLMIDNATDAGRDVRRGRAQRRDGWTPERIRLFLRVLAQRGIVAEAARAAGLSPKSAYALRNSAKGAAFARAWSIARLAAWRRPGRFVSRVNDGVIVPIMRRGKVWGQHRRPDNRYIMRVLSNLDRMTSGTVDEEVLRGMEDFDACVARAAASAASFPAQA